ncbi:MAG: 4-alpha-glucanotransferase [Defluviitaleaceae bacterium]|nr:4-alpha-glucanotransferase [Defluviitaleaceae bacterium]MCL2239831.1 4-alpha-glucanotransferase [Defluviitaleaceae bacterium]
MFNKRASGVLAHPTSFPSPYGMGDLGQGAYDFIDFLAQAKQCLWQVLPLGPTGFGDSPYQSFSAFAGNPYLISPDALVEAGWLTEGDVADIPGFDAHSVDFGPVIAYKMELFRKAYARFLADATPAQKSKLTQFCARHKAWLTDYALFTAIKAHLIEKRANEFKTPELAAYGKKMKKFLNPDQVNDYYYGAAWSSWPEDIARREPKALKEAATQLAEEVRFAQFLQYEFFRQWDTLKGYANKKNIRIIGDIPIFVALDSADVWAAPELYCIDKDWPTAVAGVPPDYFSETGQLWGNPLYDWAAHKKDNYAWWCRRAEAVLDLVDIVRIDHFRGFEAYWAVPAGEKTAIKGKWIKGPGKPLFDALKKHLKDLRAPEAGGSFVLPIIAEDLGIITEKVDKLRTDFNLPGMKVLQFAFTPGDVSAYLPHNYENNQTVVYSGTHDNDTSLGWYEAAGEAERDYLRRYANVSGTDVAWDLIRLAMASVGIFAIVPIQDIFSLGTAARMNQPGQATGWWRFRYSADMLQEDHAKRLAYLVELYHR